MCQSDHVPRTNGSGHEMNRTALALFALPELSAPRAVKLDTAPVAYLQRHLGQSRFFSLRAQPVAQPRGAGHQPGWASDRADDR